MKFVSISRFQYFIEIISTALRTIEKTQHRQTGHEKRNKKTHHSQERVAHIKHTRITYEREKEIRGEIFTDIRVVDSIKRNTRIPLLHIKRKI